MLLGLDNRPQWQEKITPIPGCYECRKLLSHALGLWLNEKKRVSFCQVDLLPFRWSCVGVEPLGLWGQLLIGALLSTQTSLSTKQAIMHLLTNTSTSEITRVRSATHGLCVCRYLLQFDSYLPLSVRLMLARGMLYIAISGR